MITIAGLVLWISFKPSGKSAIEPLILTVYPLRTHAGTRSLTSSEPLPFTVSVLSPVVVALIWRAMYFTDWGVIDTILKYLGLSSLSRVWLGEPGVVMTCLTVAYVWYQIGTTMVIYLAGLQNIPTELYESAMIDGAGKFHQFVAITFPMLAPAITINVLFVIVNALKTFDFPFALTEGGPEYFSRVVTLQIYFYAFRGIKYGLGTALSVAYTLFILILSVSLVRILRKREQI